MTVVICCQVKVVLDKVDLRMVPTNKEVFLCGTVYDYAGKVDPCKGYRDQKRKLGVSTHFSVKYKAMYGVFSKLRLKSAWLPQIFFYDTKSTC